MGQFGEYLKNKRKEKNITTRQMSRDLEIAVSYISELESGVKLPPNSSKKEYSNLLDKIILYLDLNDEESIKLKELADMELGSKGYLSSDIMSYIDTVHEAMIALRKAKNANLTTDDWNNILDKYINGDK